MADQLVIVEAVAVGQGHQAETARIGKPDYGAVSDVEYNVFMRAVAAGIVDKAARP